MRMFFAVLLWTALWPLQAYAACECKCVDGRVQSVCTAPNEAAIACIPAACTAALPPGFPPLAATPIPQVVANPPVNSNQQTQPQAAQQARQEPGPTITVPPSTTGPASGPPAFSPDGGRTNGEATASSTTTGQRQPPSTSSPSITHSDLPTVIAPNAQSLCYDRSVFNSDTLEYEWRRACD